MIKLTSHGSFNTTQSWIKRIRHREWEHNLKKIGRAHV